MDLLYGHGPAVAQWVADRIPHVHDGFGPCEAIGVVSDRLVAGVVYHDYQPHCENIQISMAADSPMWARRQIIKGLLSYPFHDLGCFMLWTAIPLDNDMAIRVNAHIGLKRKPVVPHAFGPKRHAVIFQMTAPEFTRLYGD